MGLSCGCPDLFDDAGANADRVLGPGPGAGGRIVVEAPQLNAIARQFGVDWRPASLSDRAVLDRPGRPLRREDVLDAVKSALIAAGASADCDIELSGLHPTACADRGRNASRWCPTMDYDTNAGHFTAVLSITGEAWTRSIMRLVGRVDDTSSCRSPPTRLLPAACCAPKMSIWRACTPRRSTARLRIGSAMQIGMQLQQPLAAGQPFALGELMRPAMVQKGADVLIELDSPGITLTAQGQALECRCHRRAHPGAESDLARGRSRPR